MRTLALICALMWAADTLADDTLSRITLFDGTAYEFSVSGVRMSGVPTWKDQAMPPPLGIPEAAKAARTFISEIPARERFTWGLEELSLCRIPQYPEHWMYKVVFLEDLADGNAYEGPIQRFVVVILLDGAPAEHSTKRK